MKQWATALAIALAACSSGGADDDCIPAPDAVWLTEGELLELPIDCGVEQLAPLPDGASYDPDAALLTWTPRLDQAGVYLVQVGDTHELKIGVADAWDQPSNVPIVDPLSYTEEYGLPVLFLAAAPTSGDTFQPIDLVYRGHAFEAAEGKIRGGVSRNYPKGSYTLQFHTRDRFDEPERDFLNRRKIVLTSTFDDNSLIRQRLAFDLWNALDPDNLQIRTFHAILYIDRQYWGVYLVGDHVDQYFMEQRGLSSDGNVYKAINHDANFMLTNAMGDPKTTLHDGYEKKEGSPADDFSDLEDLVTFAATASSEEFLAQVDTRLRRVDYENWFIFVTAIMADDSAGKNSYHYHDPLGGPWRFAPWDFNHSFGQTWQTLRMTATEARTYTNRNRLFDRFLAEPTIADPLIARYARTLRDQYDAARLQELIDGYVAELGENAYRDEARWTDEYRSYGGWSQRTDFTDYDGELDYVRAWIGERWSYLLNAYPE